MMVAANMADTTISRRSTRLFPGQQSIMETGNSGQPGQESLRSSSGDERERRKDKLPRTKQPPCGSETPMISLLPLVDFGKDLRGIFPATMEDADNHVMTSLQAAKESSKSRGEGRPINFGVVLPGSIYRSSFPMTEDFQFLGTLGLRTIVSLVQKDLASDFKSFMKTNSIQHLIVNMQGTKKVEIPAASMNLLMKIVLNPENHPVLIHCNHGKHRTGCAVAVVRHCAGWKIDAIVEEYQGFAEPKIRDCDVKYIKNYQVADLDGLFKEQRRRHDPVLTSYKMLRYMLGTAMMLIFWIFTVVSWKDH